MSTDPGPAQVPLKGKYAAVACSPDKSAGLLNGLRAMGAIVEPLAVIAIRELEDQSALDAALLNRECYSWILFTSSYAAQIFARRMRATGLTGELARLKNVCAVGPGTAATLREAGIGVSLIPDEFVAEGVLRALAARHGGPQGLAGLRILFPRAREARDVLPRELGAAGARVDVIACYETVQGVIDPMVRNSLLLRGPDLLVFTSSSAVRNFVSLLGAENATILLNRASVAALGPITAASLESCGRKPEILPRENTIPALLEAIREHFAAQRASELD
jgi:uroporphyrinogen III methyltransferase/synthase